LKNNQKKQHRVSQQSKNCRDEKKIFFSKTTRQTKIHIKQNKIKLPYFPSPSFAFMFGIPKNNNKPNKTIVDKINLFILLLNQECW
jgi:hypothetical protein